jgi:ceroid-lipofuscinosis protein 8
VFASTDESWTFVCVLTGFFMFEELTLIYFDIKYRTFSRELHMHHICSFNGFFIVAYYNIGHYYSAKTFILEGSTPFSCICWCLLKLKLEKTKVWKINQWILIYIFHLRTVYELWVWYDVYQDWNNFKENLPWAYMINMFVGLGTVTVWLTPYWTYKKTVQFFQPTDWNAEVKGKKKDEIDKTS